MQEGKNKRTQNKTAIKLFHFKYPVQDAQSKMPYMYVPSSNLFQQFQLLI